MFEHHTFTLYQIWSLWQTSQEQFAVVAARIEQLINAAAGSDETKELEALMKVLVKFEITAPLASPEQSEMAWPQAMLSIARYNKQQQNPVLEDSAAAHQGQKHCFLSAQ